MSHILHLLYYWDYSRDHNSDLWDIVDSDNLLQFFNNSSIFVVHICLKTGNRSNSTTLLCCALAIFYVMVVTATWMIRGHYD